jgi:hypothetical protein
VSLVVVVLVPLLSGENVQLFRLVVVVSIVIPSLSLSFFLIVVVILLACWSGSGN